MGKFFTTLLVVLGLCTTAFAQSFPGAGANEFGINVGINGSTVTTGDNQTNSDYRTGFNVGVSADHYFSDRWSLKVKAIYDQKGWDRGFIDDGSGAITTDYKLNYITVPVMANWHFGSTRNWYLNFGPYVGFLLNASETAGGTNLKPFFNSTDVGFALGLGVKFPISENAKLFLELQGTGGGTDLIKDNTGSSLRSSVSSFNIGVNF